MITKCLTLFLFLFLISNLSLAQRISIEVPTKIQARVGEELSIKLNVAGVQKYSVTMEGNPPSSSIRNGSFVWTPKTDDAKNHFVKFFLKDSVGTRLSEADMELWVDAQAAVPTIVFDRSLQDTIRVEEGQLFFISGAIKSGNGSDTKTVSAYFMFNENPDLRTFDSCGVNRMGDQILFRWTPSNREAVQGYAKFRITLVSSDNVVGTKVLNFKIKNVNEKPKFVNEIPDTVFIPPSEDLVLDISVVDPDGDKLKYDFFPKGEQFYLERNKIIFKQDIPGNNQNEFPIRLLVSVTDGEYSLKKSILIRRNKLFQQPSIGDFTRDEFYEGDSLVTYLNISNDSDLKQFEIKFSDLALPPGIGAITSHLIFEKGLSYIKVYSKGVLPYYLVDRDYNYNVAVTLSSKGTKLKPVFKVLELKVKDRPDPTSVGHQKDSLIENINRFLKIENIYKSNLEKMHGSINRPWWKKVAVITGTLSGILSIVQSQDPDKDVSVVAAAVSLVSITVTNLPSLKEKTLTSLNDKIANSKGRIELIQEKESDFRANWSFDIDRSSFDKMKADLLERINKSETKRKEDVCFLLTDKTLKRKIKKLLQAKGGSTDNAFERKNIFKCPKMP